MKASDIQPSDPELLLYDEDKKHYFRLEYLNCILDGFSEAPLTVILKKGKRVYKKDVWDAHETGEDR